MSSSFLFSFLPSLSSFLSSFFHVFPFLFFSLSPFPSHPPPISLFLSLSWRFYLKTFGSRINISSCNLAWQYPVHYTIGSHCKLVFGVPIVSFLLFEYYITIIEYPDLQVKKKKKQVIAPTFTLFSFHRDTFNVNH